MNKTAGENFSLNRTLVLIGMMGSGKTTIGRHLAEACNLPFHDADKVIEQAHGVSIGEIFTTQGEAAFRAMERDMIAKLLLQGPIILSPGGGAFINSETRAVIKASGAVTVWLKVDEDILLRRVTRNSNRPLLKDDPKGKLEKLLRERTPIYEQADLAVSCDDGPIKANVEKILDALRAFAS